MRLHFISRLALLVLGAFLVVASQEAAWAGGTLQWMFVVGGALAIVIAGAHATLDTLEQRSLDFLTALIGAWMIVEVLALSSGSAKWWSFGSALAVMALSAVGLVIHEWSTERVVHELRVTHHEDVRRRSEQATPIAG
jgi:hypothetical protein